MDEDEDDEVGVDQLPASRRGAINKLKRRIKALENERKAQNRELTKYKLALANSNHTLTRNDIAIPENAKIVGGIVDSGEVANVQRPLVLHTPQVAETGLSIANGDFPYRLELCDIPDTSTIVKDTKFDIKLTSFPHGVCLYNRTAEKFAPHVESRRPIPLKWKLVNRVNPAIACTEKDLCPGEAHPKVYFRLKLVYPDDGTEVTLEGLNHQGQGLSALSEPNIIGNQVRMVGGTINFKLKHLQVLSSMTIGLHRKFRFEVECLHGELKKHEHMHSATFDFYSVARIRVKEGGAA